MSNSEDTELNSREVILKTRARSWCFTWNNPTTQPTQLTQLFEAVGDVNKYAFQLEEGENGTRHFQGVVAWRNQIGFKTLKAIDASIHWERCKQLRASLQYCTKRDSRVAGPWVLGWEPDAEELGEVTLRDWQKSIEKLLETGQGDRSILWIADRVGNNGKTFMAKYLVRRRRDTLFVTGKAGDIKYAIVSWLKRRKLGCCIFHFVRSQEEYVSYQAIEEIKDGIFFSTKYESGMCVFESPVIIIMANFYPDRSKLTGDRWDVREIEDGELVEVDTRVIF